MTNEIDDLKIVSQPPTLSVPLYKHQLRSIYMMEEIEREKSVKLTTNTRICTNIGILADSVGYGKTLSVVGLLLRDKMEWNDVDYLDVVVSNGNQYISTKTTLIYKKINATLIVVNQALYTQWFSELRKSNLKIGLIHKRIQIEEISVFDYDVILCLHTMYNYLVTRYQNHAWKRFVFDEPCSIKIAKMLHITAGFWWLVTATPYKLFGNTTTKNFITSIMPSEEFVFRSIIIKNSDDILKQSFEMPPISHVYHDCFQPIYDVVNGFISNSVLEMISAGNIRGAIDALGGDIRKSCNIVEIICNKKTRKLDEIKLKIQHASQTGDDESRDMFMERQKKLLQDIDDIKGRFNQLMNSRCPICCEGIQNPVFVYCCQNIFCGYCLIRWLKQSTEFTGQDSTCPLCRSVIMVKSLTYIHDTSVPEILPQRKTKTKLETIGDIIHNKSDGKFIIFSSYNQTFDNIRKMLEERNISYAEIKGSRETCDKHITEFKHGNLNVLFLNSNCNGAGINLQEATDIIMYHKMNEHMQCQVVGRSHRLGRVKPLTIHHLL